ncbi:MAG TPA: ABC transporter substrate-binding protein [Acidimicrobiales bacterium]|nr:ABC transporter substrate-binding protein [Acidimicrobiales bacterium]
MVRTVRWTALALALLLLAGACGQKPGVALSAGGATAATGTGAVADVATADTVPVEDAAVDAAGTDAATSSGGGSDGAPAAAGATVAKPGAPTTARPGTTGGTSGGTTGGGTAGAVAAPSAGPNDKNGVSDKEIVIGIHAPVTGAAPFPQSTFEEGKEVYWKAKGPINGRTVRVEFFDDQFNPSRAVQVCRELVESKKVFLLIGGGGADQITACAKYANQVGVPYLSAGVNQNGLETLKTYFALSLTYSQQSPIIASLVKNKLGKTKIGILVADTPSFADAQASFTKAATDAGLTITYNKKINKSASQSETLTAAQQLQASGAEAVYVLTAPTVFLQLAQQANSQGYNPQYVGPGITSGLNTVATVGCPGIGEARFLSPFPGLDDPAAVEYQAAYQKQNDKAGDDIGFALWGLSAILAQMFQESGTDLGRAKFMQTVQSGKAFSGGVYPEAKYAPGKPFGGSAMHLLRADCGARKYVTEAKNSTGF